MWLPDYRPCSRFHTSKENQGMIQVTSNFDQTHPFCHTSSKSHTRDELLLGWCHGRTKYIATTTVVPRGPRNQMAWSNYLSQNGYGAASKVLWFHWVLAQVLDTLKVCNPFVHKLSWTSTWDWQHFGNHLSCPCATCALNLAWFDCHCYRRGMNRCRSPRVFISLLLLYYWW